MIIQKQEKKKVTIHTPDVAIGGHDNMTRHFFLVQDEDDEWHAIGLILPQEYENGNLSLYAVTVDTVEAITGIDFYPSLDDEIEIIVESELGAVWLPW